LPVTPPESNGICMFVKNKKMETNNNVSVRYKLKGIVLSTKEVEANKHLFNPKCFNSNEKTSAILELRESTPIGKTSILYIHEDCTFSTERD
jgi:hypothetical protein